MELLKNLKALLFPSLYLDLPDMDLKVHDAIEIKKGQYDKWSAGVKMEKLQAAVS